MDIESLVKEKTGYMEWFYKTSVEPFNKIKKAIDEEKEPYASTLGEETDEPPFLEEWIKAENGAQIVGHACISMLAETLKLYLKLWEKRLKGELGEPYYAVTNMDDWAATNKESWPAHALKKLGALGWDVSSCPADTSILEQVILCRNCIQHPDSYFLGFLGIRYSEKDTDRFSKPLFSNELDLEMFSCDFKPGKFIRPSVSSAEGKILEAISQVEDFFSWLESEYERSTRRQ